MRVVNVSLCVSICTALALGACASVKKREYSELDVATVAGCQKPSMDFHELRDERAKPIAATALPLFVKPGTYMIGIECAWAHDRAGACVDTHGDPELKVSTYNLILYPSVRYAFSCDLEGKEYVIRMNENARN
jgi:hypothetical protein